MEVEYQNTLESLQVLRRLVVGRQCKRLILMTGMYVALIGVPPSLFFLAKGSWPAIIMIWSLILIAMVALALYAKTSMRSLMQSILDRGMPNCRVRITPQVFASSDDWGWSRNDWGTISRVVQAGDHVMIFVDQATTVHVIPCSAFASADEAQSFATNAESYRKAAQEQEHAQFQPPPAPLATDGSQLQVTFRNLPEHQAAVERDVHEQKDLDLKPPKKQGRDPMVGLAFSFILCLLCLGISPFELAVLPRGIQCAIALVLFLVWGIVLLCADQKIRFWLARRAGKKTELLTTVTVAPAGLLLTTKTRESFSSWRAWEDIRNARNFILFCTVKQHVALIVPKRAFENSEAADHFAAVTKRYWEAARQAESAAQMVEVVRDDDDNPYRSPFAN